MSNVEVFFPVFVIYPILLIVFAKKYNWTNWKEKLFGTVINNQFLSTDTVYNNFNEAFLLNGNHYTIDSIKVLAESLILSEGFFVAIGHKPNTIATLCIFL